MSTAMFSIILIINLGDGDVKPEVLKKFEHHRQRDSLLHGRDVIKGRKTDGDVEMADPESDSSADEDVTSPTHANVFRIALSADGQWLATSDDHARTHIFNMDSLQVRCSRIIPVVIF